MWSAADRLGNGKLCELSFPTWHVCSRQQSRDAGEEYTEDLLEIHHVSRGVINGVVGMEIFSQCCCTKTRVVAVDQVSSVQEQCFVMIGIGVESGNQHEVRTTKEERHQYGAEDENDKDKDARGSHSE